jgi:hypothetical protein
MTEADLARTEAELGVGDSSPTLRPRAARPGTQAPWPFDEVRGEVPLRASYTAVTNTPIPLSWFPR